MYDRFVHLNFELDRNEFRAFAENWRYSETVLIKLKFEICLPSVSSQKCHRLKKGWLSEELAGSVFPEAIKSVDEVPARVFLFVNELYLIGV